MIVKTARERIALMILPGVLTAIIYIYGPGATAQSKLKQAAAEREDAQLKSPAPSAVAAVRTELENVRTAARDALAKSAQLQQPVEALPPSRAGAEGQVLHVISHTFAMHGMTLLKSERLSKDVDLLPKTIRESWKSVGEHIQLSTPQIWKFEADGSYAAILEVCADLKNAPERIIPLTIALESEESVEKASAAAAGLSRSADTLQKEPREKRGKRWTLTVWL